ncbi:CDP-alcohol phosphatidyltransferase family protein [Novosphingobium sp.]|jgi:phosphatidylglycerophosphate synthase|uniref:CDP-alcohol phosphatidyltransferase family protein n=1 Tax=Novosphingobium sp. TaxID=1874826 RepID=UPI0022C33B1E|nr:CDP-alcohol phosphatidyltransferase family protein [Novosphingobium sp.]MCZ8018156.1 CDP-alcohol phosphatidyltransferase family protein [Novosphingobium sp.]MCZ8033150.1 CDP-alcohol phosphatidyltransferase family protein [Novosphingobium sp.]MCZ8051605.1 CDP-alcohol phosphatidyltransferase family protein [Novosphingobium sp.]MCZ8060147.1 CDP-alcohol phosphatidyltransferase family protein [Novosphingobium sp.]MCZ8231789.1 CDP-alcohol phosphatidyltransferase family protein [Novosphingobium sp
MLDARLRPLIDPPLNALGRVLARAGISANAVTLAGLIPALGAAWALAEREFLLALALILANRLLDGLDGAVARVRGLTDFGGFLDILLDFVFYVAVPLGFALSAPDNVLPALVLVASFTLTGTSFLAFATLAAKRGLETAAHGRKSFFYNTGLAEGTETILVFCAMCLWPQHFAPLAYGYAALCLLTVGQRALIARAMFRD